MNIDDNKDFYRKLEEKRAKQFSENPQSFIFLHKNMYTLTDIWNEKYFNDDGSLNPDCHYFDGVHPDNKKRILNEYFSS